MANPDPPKGQYTGRSEAVLAVTIVFLILTSLFVFFRIISRAAVVKKVGIDDYFIVLAWIIGFGMSFCVCYGTLYGLGRHERDIPSSWQPTLERTDYAFEVLYQPALMASKTSILIFYLALPTKNKIFKWACIGTLVVVNAGGLALDLVTVFQCRPIGASFDYPTPSHAQCTDIVTIYLSSAPLNIITDLAIFFLPMPILTGMRLPRKQKIILVITFGFGVFVVVVDVLRIAFLQSAAATRIMGIQQHASSQPGQSLHNREYNDFSWYGSLSYMWSVLEVDVGIMCACVPALKPLVSRFVPHLLRDADDMTSPERTDFLRSQSDPAEMAEEQRVPSMQPLPEDVAQQDFSQAPVNASAGGRTVDEQIDMMDFLTTPDMTELPGMERTQTALTNSSRNTQPAPQNFFDFVNMKRTKSLVYMTPRESIFPIAMVSILFFIWGFEYGLIDVLNKQFQRVSHMTPGQSTGIHSAYYAGYFAGPTLVGRWVLFKWGFKACFVVGLSIYACGTLIFWPAAVLTSFPAFLITNFIVAFGLSILEVASNPFIALCGPSRYGEMRLNFSQGVQAVGSVVAPLIANRAFFSDTPDAGLLVNAQWAYLGIALFTILLAAVFFYVPLPEATDQELEDASERIDNANSARIGGVGIIWITLTLGVFSQFCYVGGQEVNATIYNTYIAFVAPGVKISDYLAIAHTAFAVSRFLAAALGFFIKPRHLLLFFFTGAIVFEVLAMNFSGDSGISFMTLAFFMEGPLFSLIFAQTLRGMGRHTKLASVFITAAVSGGAVFAPISSHLSTTRNPRIMYSLVVAVAAFAGGMVYAIYLNILPQARVQVDPIADATSPASSRPSSTASTASRALALLRLSQMKKKRNGSADGSTAEHREGKVDAS